jgi:hypothetical protein
LTRFPANSYLFSMTGKARVLMGGSMMLIRSGLLKRANHGLTQASHSKHYRKRGTENESKTFRYIEVV